MGTIPIESWLKEHARYLVSFDLNKDKRIDGEELGWALKTLQDWQSRIRMDDTKWKVFDNRQAQEGLTWGRVGLRCAARPWTFVGREGETYWLPFIAILRLDRPDLPDHYEENIPATLITGAPPSAANQQAKGMVTSDVLCTNPAVSDVMGSYSTPRPSMLENYHMEMAIAEHLSEQNLRMSARQLEATLVANIRRQLTPIGKFVQVSMTGTAFG